MKEFHILKRAELPGEIEIHSDIFSVIPSAISSRRFSKVHQEKQEPMEDKKGADKCYICDWKTKKEGTSPPVVVIPHRVANFKNDFPYLSADQRLVFLWHDDIKVRKKCLHRFKVEDFGKIDLYWLLKGCSQLGYKYQVPRDNFTIMRMVCGFNLGKLAGQTIPHFHAHYGWEVIFNEKTITAAEFALYLEEIEEAKLLLYDNHDIKLIVPWTPKGQYALDIYFKEKYEITDLNNDDIKTFAILGDKIIKKYVKLGIQNLNIVFTNSAYQRRTQPLIAHFVPRVNLPALVVVNM